MRYLLVIVLASLVSTCSTRPSLLEEVQALGELRVVTRNSPITWYVGPAGPEGPDYDLVQGFADRLGVRLKIIEAERFGDLLLEVENGRAHLAAAGLTVTVERSRRVDFGPPYQTVSQHLVCRRSRDLPRQPADLVGRRVEVVAGSSYVESLQAARGAVPELAWTENPRADATEILYRVERGDTDCTVVDSNLFAIFQRFHPELRVAFNLSEGDALAWAFQRRSDRSLIDAAVDYLTELRTAGDLEQVMERYYGHNATFDYAGTRKFIRDVEQLLPRYRRHFEAAGERAGIDWRLLAAVGYQESHWNPDAVSPKGAIGLMMLTPDTASLMGIDDPVNPVQSISAGSKYLWRMRKRIAKLAPEIPEPDLTWMALAAYNMGYGHLLDARRVTELRGADPDRWLDVKQSLPLLMERRWYSQARWGYARGQETRAYVRNIRNYYDILVWLTEGRDGYRESGPPATTVANRSSASTSDPS